MSNKERSPLQQTIDSTQWEAPTIYKVGEGFGEVSAEALGAWAARRGVDIIDPVDAIAEDLFEIRNPTQKDDEEAKRASVQLIREQGESFGNWVHFPDSRRLIRYPSRQDHRDLYTNRNHPYLTAEQLKIVGSKAVLYAGLSVGRSVVTTAFRSGIASGEGGTTIIADRDVVSPTNLNRLPGVYMDEAGVPKVVSTARELSRIDPYANIVQLSNGYAPGIDALLNGYDLAMVVDEMDNDQAKAQVRHYAHKQGIPLIMAADLGDTSMLHVERYDQGADPFNGRISPALYRKLLNNDHLSPAEQLEIKVKTAGEQAVLGEPMLVKANMGVGREHAGLSQLNTTVAIGGAVATLAMREILLGRTMDSGSYRLSMHDTLHMDAQMSPEETQAVFTQLASAA